MKKLLFLFLLTTAVFLRCSPDKDLEVQVQLYESLRNNELSLIPKNLTNVSLPDSIDLSGQIIIKHFDSTIYVFDLDQQFLVRLKPTGEFLNIIGKAGEGPQELTRVRDFYVFRERISFLRPSGDVSILKTYSTNGDFIEAQNIPVGTSSFLQLGEDDFIFFTGFNNKEFEYQTYRYQPNRDNLTGVYKHTTDQPKMPLEDYPLIPYLDGFCYWPTYSSSIHFYDDSLNIDQFISMDYGPLQLKEEFMEKAPMEAANYAFDNGFYESRFYLMNQSKLLFSGTWVKSMNEQYPTLTVVDLENKRCSTLLMKPGTKDEAYAHFYQIDERYVYSFVDGYALTDNLKESLLGSSDDLESKSSYYLVKSEYSL
ncbi:6-bladed beta-propeller [Marinoscillum sp.]|uniref:6-bladed beta-propeller n=1 Tax=Marinoscillum sp. TaxID=2024838 RepID=UPI003BAA85BF